MTVTPDTDHGITDEQQEAIGAALAQYAEAAPFPANALQDMIDDLLPALAAIRRQAAADALTEQAELFKRRAVFFQTMQRSREQAGDQPSADIYENYADRAYWSGYQLSNAAAEKIAEGYPFECAAFSQECETRVPDAGDYCTKHEPEDDENRWAE
jgi:hypothetical protein